MTYLITFACYGSHLHGSEPGAVDRKHNVPRTPTVGFDPERVSIEAALMGQRPYRLDSQRRNAVLEGIQEVCENRGWQLLAAHVRTSHVHVVVGAEAEPERIMIDFKAYASRRLNRLAADAPDRKRCTRHGSTRWLWKPEHVSAAIEYVIREQGKAMSVFEAPETE